MMRRLEIIVFAVILCGLNTPLLSGSFSQSLIYLPEKVAQGQFYRLLTHPFVHISMYHLILDGAAFLLLYSQLQAKSIARRMVHLLGIHVAVISGVTASLGHINASGYCGISGVAHGLMAVWCLERIVGSDVRSSDKSEQWISLVVLVGLIAKCIYEVTAGHVFFAWMHFGNVGVPVVASHLAGVAGAVVTYGLLNISNLIKQKQLTLSIAEVIK